MPVFYSEARRSSEAQTIIKILKDKHNEIKDVFVCDLTNASNKLFACDFIHARTLRNCVTMESTLVNSMAHTLTWECQLYITFHPHPMEKLNVMLKVLKELEPVGPIVAEEVQNVKIQNYSVNTTIMHSSLFFFLFFCLYLSLPPFPSLFLSVPKTAPRKLDNWAFQAV